jgi:phage tail sheath gpL-like
MGQIIVLGMSSSGKVPGFLINVAVGQGRVDIGTIPRYLLLVGNKTSGGTATADTQIDTIAPSTDVATLYGARSELARMIYKAQLVPGVRIKAIACAEASGGAAATATITIATDATSAGTWTYYIAGQTVTVTVASGDTPTQQAVKIVTAFSALPTIPVTAANSSGVVTLTAANVGVRGNDLTLYQDTSLKPTGSTSTLGTASSYTVNAGPGGVTGVRLAGGTGTDDLTNVLAALQGETFFTIAFANNDTGTNAPLLEAYSIAKSAIGTQRYEHIVLGMNGLFATAQTLAKTTLNQHRFQVAWCQGSESSPSEIAAAMGALRTQYEQLHPNSRFNGLPLLGIAPQRALVDRPTPGETGTQETALENGVTPITTVDGNAVCVRAITTLCTRNSLAFYGTLDVGQARTPDVAAELLQLAWETEFSVSNPYVNDDPANGEKSRPEGVATPSIWKGYATSLLSQKLLLNWFSSVSVAAEYDATNKQINTQLDLQVTPQNHRMGANLNQII